MCDKSKTAYSINNYYIEQIVALTLQSKGAWTIVMYLAGQMNDENIVYCRRDALCEATGGKLRSVTSWITALQKYGFIYVVRKDKDALISYGVPVHYEEVKGYTHDWNFWDLYLKKALKEWLPLKREPIYL